MMCRDRRKLTFYFVADKRIDFRELVRELFRCVCYSFRRARTDMLFSQVVQNAYLDGVAARDRWIRTIIRNAPNES